MNKTYATVWSIIGNLLFSRADFNGISSSCKGDTLVPLFSLEEVHSCLSPLEPYPSLLPALLLHPSFGAPTSFSPQLPGSRVALIARSLHPTFFFPERDKAFPCPQTSPSSLILGSLLALLHILGMNKII